MDFETWLYLFFILISVIVPIVRNANKKNQAENTNPDSEPEMSEEDIFEALREQLQGRQDQTIEEFDEDYEEEQVLVEEVSIDDDAAEQAYKEATRQVQKSAFEKDGVDNRSEVILDTIDLDKEDYERDNTEFEFDPVKAVIYSEILKRPEY
jgi:hypothetical protein